MGKFGGRRRRRSLYSNQALSPVLKNKNDSKVLELKTPSHSRTLEKKKPINRRRNSDILFTSFSQSNEQLKALQKPNKTTQKSKKLLNSITETLSFLKNKKLNHKNCFSINLKDILELQREEEKENNGSSVNFQKAGVTLEATVKIYEKKVESTLNATYDFLTSVNSNNNKKQKQKKINDDEVDEDENEENSDSEQDSEKRNGEKNKKIARDKKNKKRGSKNGYLLKETKKLKENVMLKYKTKLKDNNKISKLLSNNNHENSILFSLSYQEIKYLTTSNLPTKSLKQEEREEEVKRTDEIDDDEKRDLNFNIFGKGIENIVNKIKSYSSKEGECKDNKDIFGDSFNLEEILNEFKLDELQQDQDQDNVELNDWKENNNEINLREDAVNESGYDNYENDNLSFHQEEEEEEEEHEEEREEEGEKRRVNNKVEKWLFLENERNEEEANKIYNLITKENKNKNNWAGPKYWNLLKNNKKKLSKSTITTTVKRKSKKKKKLIDFNKTIDESLFKPMKKKKKREKKFNTKEEKYNLLPVDYQFNETFFRKIEVFKDYTFKRPKISVRNSSVVEEEASERDEGLEVDEFEGFDEEEDFDHGDGKGEVRDFGDFYSFQNIEKDIEEAEIRREKRREEAKKFTFNYQRSKAVDIHKLKSNLWSQIKKNISGKEEQRLVNVVKNLRDKEASKEKASIQYCFISLLHLANEKTLSLRDVPTMNEIYIN